MYSFRALSFEIARELFKKLVSNTEATNQGESKSEEFVMSKMITTINPVDFCEIEKIPYANSNDVHLKIKAAQGAYLQWKNLGFSERIENLLNLKEQLSKNKADIALKMSLEMGKPITQSVAEDRKSVV